MAQIKCDYCGGYIEDTDAYCEHCGAANKNLKRSATGTPQTIDDLKDWYKARHLPPEETTRFFIGKDIREPRAFGIYKKNNGDFVVYKNKADGTRAVRYEGKDEAYAVKELYLRLKEEILNQKSHQVSNTPSRAAASYQGSSNAGTTKKRKGSGGCLKPIIITLAILLGLYAFGKWGSLKDEKTPVTGAYYDNGSEILYFDGYDSRETSAGKEIGYYWWRYDTDEGVWNRTYCLKYHDSWPEGFDKSSQKEYEEIAEEHGIPEEDFCILYDRNYVDDGHHYEPEEGYYVQNGHTYYYLDDNHGATYGTGNHSGWYIYDDEDDDWSYYSTYDDHDTVGDELWYAPAVCMAGYTYQDWYSFSEGETWAASDFSGTEWYEAREKSDQVYEDYLEESRRESRWNDDDDDDDRWDNDSDWDWDDDNDWDSDWGDWDSDW